MRTLAQVKVLGLMHRAVKRNVHHVLLEYMACLAHVHAEAKSPKHFESNAHGPQVERTKRMGEANVRARALVVFAGLIGQWLPSGVPAQLASMEGALGQRHDLTH